MNDAEQIRQTVTSVMEKFVKPLVEEQVDQMVLHHLKDIIATATDEATRAVARKLLELAVKDQLLAKGDAK